MARPVKPGAARAEFPLLDTCVYLNSNSTGATPRGAKAALDEYWLTVERWRDEAWDRWWDDLQAYADELAALIHAPAGWAEGVRRFAGGTPAVLPALFSRPGLSIVRWVGVDAIRRRSLALTDHIFARADEARIAVATPRPHERRGGIAALRFPGDAAVARSLIADGFVCSYRGGLRIAPHFYNTGEEVDLFMDELVRRVREAA